MARTKGKRRPELAAAPYVPVPWGVLDSRAYQGATVAAKALLLELARQHDGYNNGHLHLAHKWLAPRGWPSKAVVEKARGELLERGLIVQTKQGGLFIGASLYALTWLPVSNHVGLDTSPSTYHPGVWQSCDLPPTSRREAPAPHWFNAHVAALRERRSRRKLPVKKISQPVHRDSPAPYTGTANEPLDPYTGAIEAISTPSPDPYSGDDVITPVMAQKNPSAVQSFQARIGDGLTVTAREPNPLGRTRSIRLFQTAFGHLIRNPDRPAERFPTIKALLASMPASESQSVDRRLPNVRRFLLEPEAEVL